MSQNIQVIDLFAGPGGLGEGFSACEYKGKTPFSIAISIEKDKSAHSTLLARAFFRSLKMSGKTKDYYEILKTYPNGSLVDAFNDQPSLRSEFQKAQKEARNLTLGEHQAEVDKSIANSIRGQNERILIGGPPCQAYSLVGRSRRLGDKTKQYIPENDSRNFLYQEYLHTLAKVHPAVFVMENVKGILSAKVKDDFIFQKILADLSDPDAAEKQRSRQSRRYRIIPFVRHESARDASCNFKPTDYVIRAEDFGIPQTRHRVILLGIREDILASRPQLTQSLVQRPKVSAKDAIGTLPALRSKVSKEPDSQHLWIQAVSSMSKSMKLLAGELEPALIRAMKGNLANLKTLSFPTSLSQGGRASEVDGDLGTWLADPHLDNLILNHESRGHIRGDLHRYLFCSSFAQVNGRSPRTDEFPEVLLPNHKNFTSGKFSDRFRVQRADAPATTITSHISKDGHYYIHYDPTQCRSLTVREAARLQTFPDNYVFIGNRTQQYVQVGNAVPPFLAKQLASIVAKLLLD